MSVSILQTVLQETRKLANKEFQKRIKTEWVNLGLRKGDRASDIFREELNNSSIHSISRNDILKFIYEYVKSKSIKDVNLKYLTNLYFDTLLSISKDLFKYRYTIFMLVDSRLTPTTRDAVVGLSLGTRTNISDTTSIFNTITKAKPRQNLYEEVKTRLESTNKLLLGNPNTPDILKQFIMEGIDVGHVVSNITYYSNIAVVSGIKKAVSVSDQSNLASLYSSLKDIKIRQAIKSEYLSILAADKTVLSNVDALFDYIFDSQLDLIREFTLDGRLKGTVDLKFREGNLGTSLTKAIKRIVNNAMVRVGPQNRKINSDLGSAIESLVVSNLPTIYTAMLNTASANLQNIDLVNLKGSKSFRELVEDSLSDIIIFGENKQKKSTITSTSIKSTELVIKSTSIKEPKALIKSRKVVVSKKAATSRLRATSGAFQSVTNLQALMQARLFDTIKNNMSPPALTYQTGRFAKSVQLKSLQYDNRSNAITAFLTYMRYPYATFEPGSRQGNFDRSPTSLITRSVREIAASLTTARLKAIVA